MAVFFVIAHGFKFTTLTGTSESGNNVHIVKYEKVQREFRIVLILSNDDRIGGRFLTFKKTPAGQGQCIRSPVKCWTTRLDQDLGK